MTRSRPHPLVAVLTLAFSSSIGVAFAGPQAVNEPRSSIADLTMRVEVENDARIPRADLAAMEELVSRSYLPVGVQVIWVHGEVPSQDGRGLHVHLRLLSRSRANRKIATERIGRAVLGQASRPARIVYIFCLRIVEASMKDWQEYTHVLALVVAHELAHVLLPAHSHSEAGIMKGRANLRAKIAHDFTSEEGVAIRTMLRMESEAGSQRTRSTHWEIC